MTLWTIGILFTWGLCLVDETDDVPWYQEVGAALMIAALWPLCLGVILGIKLRDKSDD